MFLQTLILVMVAIGGPVVVLTREPRRQAIVAGLYGILLAILFFAFRAPDAALSQMAVGAMALPLMILLALTRIHRNETRDESRGQEMNPKIRLAMFLLSGCGLLAIFAAGMSRLHPPGDVSGSRRGL